MGPALRRLLYALLGGGLGLGLLELCARGLPVSLVGRLELVQNIDGSGGALREVAVPGWDVQPPSLRMEDQQAPINARHMRGPDYPAPKAAGEVRVLLVGDSAIFGWRLPWEETMAAELERRREARFPDLDYQVNACASPGHSTAQSLVKLRAHGLPFQPDVVVIGNMNSDGTLWTMTDRERFGLGPPGLLARGLRELALYRLLRNARLRHALAHPGAAQPVPGAGPLRPGEGVPRVPPEEYRENLRALIALSRAAGARPLLLRPPTQARMRGGPPPPGQASYPEILAEVARQERVELADGEAAFRDRGGGEELWLSPVHPSARGARLLGALLDEALGPTPP